MVSIVLATFLNLATASLTAGPGIGGASPAAAPAPLKMRNIAHRGMWDAEVPQNTLEAIRRAYESGAMWVETDFHHTKAGQMVCIHEEKELERLAGCAKKIVDLTPEEVATLELGGKDGSGKAYRIPLLDQVLALVPSNGVLQAEIKDYSPEYADVFDRAVKAAGLAERNIVVSSFRYGALKDFRARYPKYRTVWLVGLPRGKPFAAGDWIARCKAAGFDVFCPGCGSTRGRMTRADADAVRAAGLEFRVYGVDSREDLEQAKALGATGFTCNSWKDAFAWAEEVGGIELVGGVEREVKMLEGEHWWGVMNYYGSQMPFDARTDLVMDVRAENMGNQAASFLVSDKGRSIWCDGQTRVTVRNGTITMEAGMAPVEVDESGRTLRDAFVRAAARHFPSSGKAPDLLFFSAPQYNTWIELTYHQNEKDILAYAQSMLDNGLPPGVFMIDDTWQAGYGDWRFEPTRFADPKGMVDKLHAMGFKVVLWMCPYVSMDTPAYRRIAWGVNPDDVKGYATRGGFLCEKDGGANPGRKTPEPAAIGWWNGKSAFLDFTHPNANAWFREQLDGLVRDFGVDGFKFDGGHFGPYAQGYRTWKENATCGEQVLGYAKFALEYPVSEYRNAWRFQGLPVVERLHDKNHSWAGVAKLVPDMIAGGLLGHPFMCPDMVGGGEWTAFIPGSPFDPDIFVRSAQVHALCGMMQFSASPWRCLDGGRQQIIRDLVKMRQEKFAAYFVELAKECGRTGEPMIRNLEYEFPGMGYAGIADQFMMGHDLLVAPVVEKGATSRKVVLPPGRWLADDGKAYDGPAAIEVAAPLARLPHFRLDKATAGVR